MKDSQGTVIYVGKAGNLRSRASSYFMGEASGKHIKTRFLVERAADIEAILTATEYEALVLENNLIKRYKPRYNISLKDGKTYPVIRITTGDFPRVFRTRQMVRDGSVYFGPYPDVRAVDVYIDLIHRLYPLRRCAKLRRRESPCLYYHIGRCSAPCAGKISAEEYGKMIRRIRNLLAGRHAGLRKALEKQMKDAAAELNFERAAELRDALRSMDALETEPAVMDFRDEARDYVDFTASGRYVVFGVILMRGGAVTGRELYTGEYAGDARDALPEFLMQYYSERGRQRPGKLFLPELPGELVERFFAEGPGAEKGAGTGSEKGAADGQKAGARKGALDGQEKEAQERAGNSVQAGDEAAGRKAGAFGAESRAGAENSAEVAAQSRTPNGAGNGPEVGGKAAPGGAGSGPETGARKGALDGPAADPEKSAAAGARGRAVPQMLIPESRRDMAVLAMVKQNAAAELDRLIRKEGDRPALEELKSVLGLPRLPRRIEGFDIAQLHGKYTVASLITFLDGRPDRSGYRHYNIRSTAGGIDDFLSISEAVARRYQRLVNEDKPLPDLILVDGGKGQVSAAWNVLKALGLEEKVPLAGLAKKHEEIWRPGAKEPVRLPQGDPGLRVLQYVRDETHRFATSRNQKLRSRELMLSTLEGVPGIGPAKSARLLTRYKSLDGIYEQAAEDIARTAGVGEAVAETVREFLGRALDKR